MRQPTPVPRRWGWILSLVLASLVFFVLGVLVGIDRERANAVYAEWGGFATFWGFVLTAVGFSLTIWTVLQSNQVNLEAHHEIEQAISRAQEEIERTRRETWEAIRKIGQHLLGAEAETIARLLLAAREAAEAFQWSTIVALSQEASHAVRLLAANPHLVEPEREGLRAASDELYLIVDFVRRNRINRGDRANISLPAPQLKQLSGMRRFISAIQARLRGEVLEVSDAP
jgi:hypothetical protein